MFTFAVTEAAEFSRHPIHIRTRHPVSAPPPESDIHGWFSSAPQRCIQAHDQLFRQGEPRAQVYLVTQGAFVLYRLFPNGQRQVTGFARAGDVLGLGAISNHRCTAEASSAAKVRGLPAIALHQTAQNDAEFGLRLYQAISRELQTIQDQLLMVGRLDAGQRVATFLLGLYARDDPHSQACDQIDLPMTRCDIADYLGLTTETVSRTLTKLVNRGILARVGGSLRVLDAMSLESVALGDDMK
jgi:CRP/FNR family transcriptional regulator, anaerobic regulatory protein